MGLYSHHRAALARRARRPQLPSTTGGRIHGHMGTNEIVILGAREHNLKDISLGLPRPFHSYHRLLGVG